MRLPSVVGLFGLILLARPAVAQMGTGWVEYQPPSTIHLDGSAGIETYPGTSVTLMNEGASFSKTPEGLETFALHDPISNRAERRVQNTYLTGRRQFEGEVRVSPPTNDESVMQIFGGNSGATTQMIRAYDVAGGTLRKVPGAVVLAENIHGTWIKVNVIHDIPGNNVKTYINGRLLATGDGEATGAGNDGWYHKYGCYGTLRTGSAKVEWRNVKHFRDGESPPGGGEGAAPDAGVAPDADPPAPAPADAAPAPPAPDPGPSDAAAPGAGPASPGTGGSGPADPAPRPGDPEVVTPPAGPGSGCQLAAGPAGGASGAALLLLAAAGVLMRLKNRRVAGK